MVYVTQDFGEREAEQAGTSGLSASAGGASGFSFCMTHPGLGVSYSYSPTRKCQRLCREEERKRGREENKLLKASSLGPQRART